MTSKRRWYLREGERWGKNSWMKVPRYESREGIQGAAGSNADLSSLISSHLLIIRLNFAHPASSHGMCPSETSVMFTPLHLAFALHIGPSA